MPLITEALQRFFYLAEYTFRPDKLWYRGKAKTDEVRFCLHLDQDKFYLGRNHNHKLWKSLNGQPLEY